MKKTWIHLQFIGAIVSTGCSSVGRIYWCMLLQVLFTDFLLCFCWCIVFAWDLSTDFHWVFLFSHTRLIHLQINGVDWCSSTVGSRSFSSTQRQGLGFICCWKYRVLLNWKDLLVHGVGLRQVLLCFYGCIMFLLVHGVGLRKVLISCCSAAFLTMLFSLHTTLIHFYLYTIYTFSGWCSTAVMTESGGTLLACVVICPVRPSYSLSLSLICLSLKQLVY